MTTYIKATFLASIAIFLGACAATNDGAEAQAAEGDEQDLTEAPYLEVVKTDDAQGSKIVAHGLPAVSRNADGLELAALLMEKPSTVAGYTGYTFDERDGMGSFTGAEIPLLSVDTKTASPTVTVYQNFVDLANAKLKEGRWSRLVEHAATNNSVVTSFGWTVTYEPKAPSYPKLHVLRDGQNVLTKGAGYFKDQAFGPSGCSYVPELVSAAISTQHKAVLLRVHYNSAVESCAVTDKFFTEELP